MSLVFSMRTLRLPRLVRVTWPVVLGLVPVTIPFYTFLLTWERPYGLLYFCEPGWFRLQFLADVSKERHRDFQILWSFNIL